MLSLKKTAALAWRGRFRYNEPMDTNRKNQNKKKLAAGTAVVAAGALMVNGLFGEPAELLDTQAAVELESAELMEEETIEAGDEQKGVRQRLRARIAAAPAALRLLVFLPLWALGQGLGLLLPLAVRPLGLGAAVLGAAAAAAKLLWPDLPLKKLFCRRSFGIALLTAGLLYAVHALLPLVWEDYETALLLLEAGLGLGGGIFLLWPHVRQKTEAPPTETMEEARRRVLQMADEAGRR